MNVIIDLIAFSLQKSGGISVYWYELISKMLSQQEVKPLFIEESENVENIFRKELKILYNQIIGGKPKLVDYLSRYRDIDLDIKNQNFIYHSTYYRTLHKGVKKNNKVKEIVTVHDFTYEHYSKGLKKWVHCWQKKRAIKAADIVICISENTKRDLFHFYPQFLKKDVRVLYNGVSSDYFENSKLRYNANDEDFFLFVGSRANYKNFDFTVKSIAQTENYKLKIVGGNLNERESLLLNKFLPDRWELLTNIGNKELNVLYNNTFALIYPSSYEGFGIPIVEAMKAGCPFIALNCSSIPEVAGNAGFLMETLDVFSFNKAIFEIKKNREDIINKGFVQASKFSWDKCYQEVLEIYKELNKQLI